MFHYSAWFRGRDLRCHGQTLAVARNHKNSGSFLGALSGDSIGGFPKIRGAPLGVPIIRISMYFGDPYWGLPILRNHHIS